MFSALVDTTTVTIYYSDGVVAESVLLVNMYDIYDYRTNPTDFHHISADKPVHVSQFARPGPFMVVLDSVTGFKSSRYVFTTMESVVANFTNTVHITIATDDKDGVLVDCGSVESGSWVDMATTGFSIVRVDVTEGVHKLSHSANKKFSAFLYGQEPHEAYGLSIHPAPRSYSFTPWARSVEEALSAVIESTHVTPAWGLCFSYCLGNFELRRNPLAS